jgi:hypothetical protein
MGLAAWICGILGGLAAVWGGLTAFDVLPASVTDHLTVDWTFWFYAAIVLVLGAIALKGARGGGGVD